MRKAVTYDAHGGASGAALKQFAADRGLEVTGSWSDTDPSLAIKERPQFKAMMENVGPECEVEVIVVPARSHLEKGPGEPWAFETMLRNFDAEVMSMDASDYHDGYRLFRMGLDMPLQQRRLREVAHFVPQPDGPLVDIVNGFSLTLPFGWVRLTEEEIGEKVCSLIRRGIHRDTATITVWKHRDMNVANIERQMDSGDLARMILQDVTPRRTEERSVDGHRALCMDYEGDHGQFSRRLWIMLPDGPLVVVGDASGGLGGTVIPMRDRMEEITDTVRVEHLDPATCTAQEKLVQRAMQSESPIMEGLLDSPFSPSAFEDFKARARPGMLSPQYDSAIARGLSPDEALESALRSLPPPDPSLPMDETLDQMHCAMLSPDAVKVYRQARKNGMDPSAAFMRAMDAAAGISPDMSARLDALLGLKEAPPTPRRSTETRVFLSIIAAIVLVTGLYLWWSARQPMSPVPIPSVQQPAGPR